jgi:cyclophilin family peptidyl-prolyl cis-trans isomerase
MIRTIGLIAALLGAAALAQAQASAAAPVTVLMKTSRGDITLELYPDKAPLTVKNFLSYVDAKFYDGTIFHRAIPQLIQGGGLTPDFVEKRAKAPIRNESGNGLRNGRGSIAMARTEDLNSATCQFYINATDNFGLDGGKYCVFGKVVAGLDVVDAIAAVPTTTVKVYENAPRQTVTILSVTRVPAK